MEHHLLCHSLHVQGASCSCAKNYRQDAGAKALLEFSLELRALAKKPAPHWISEKEQRESARWFRHCADKAESRAHKMAMATIPIVMRSQPKPKKKLLTKKNPKAQK